MPLDVLMNAVAPLGILVQFNIGIKKDLMREDKRLV